MARVYGIDLGTTYSCIASYDGNNKPEALHPSNAVSGGVNLPSVIYYEKETGKPVVGVSSKNALGAPGEVGRIMTYTKRYMGQDFYPKKIRVVNDEINISPVEGSACILHHLLSCANEESRGKGEEVTNKAVITIPAGFTNKQRECTKLAAELAGIEVLGLVHEPTAAAISYDIKSGETILVFDLGGGTLDVSVVTNDKGNYKVIAAAGDYDVLGRNIGGKDWDDKLMELAMKKHGYKLGGIPNTPEETEKWQLMSKIEDCKKDLSSRQETEVFFPDFTREKITKKDFWNYTDDLVKDCLKVVKATLEKAGSVNIDRCVLAGGSSNMPMIKFSISRYLSERIANNRSEDKWLFVSNPERAIAEGAARYAYMLTNDIAKDHGVLVSVEEKSSHSYGTKIQLRTTGDMLIRNLILSSDPMIVDSRPFEFGVMEDGQPDVHIDIYENNSMEKRIPYDSKVRQIYDGVYNFDSKSKVNKSDTRVFFKVSRNKDGIISIHVESQGHHSEDYNISTVMPPITEETKKHIAQSLELMDKITEERK